MKYNGVEFDALKIAEFCRRHGRSDLMAYVSQVPPAAYHSTRT